MRLRDIIDDYTIKIYELNRAINAPDMYGALLFKGNAKLVTNPVHLYKRVFRIFEYKELGYTVVIVD